MKKRDKKLEFSRETVRDLTTSSQQKLLVEAVGGGAFQTCIPGGTTHCSALC